jgi:hypothetical protein
MEKEEPDSSALFPAESSSDIEISLAQRQLNAVLE